ncbi:hypothetical protein CDL15_Pgr007595 [Punica granatum]|nr:hypothetical protein CDL15_Pgr007595 [Punica granatum]
MIKLRHRWCSFASRAWDASVRTRRDRSPMHLSRAVTSSYVPCANPSQQVEVLAPSAIGRFVSHCGRNSTLESMWFGVPVAAWPMYAEHHFNAFALVVEMGIAVEICMDYKRNLMGDDKVIVMAEEIERGISHLKEAEGEGRKEKVKLMSERSRRALPGGGSSY